MAGLKPFRKRGGGTEESFQVQSAVETALTPLSSSIINGTLLENLSVDTTATNIAHKLGRSYRGYLVCRCSALVTVSDQVSEDNSLFIKITSSAPAIISLWVF